MLFVFDWDGTLSDSTDKIVACMRAAASDLSLPELSPLEVREIIGLSLPEAIARLYPSESGSARRELASGYGAHFAAADETPSLFFPGVVDTLAELKVLGHSIAVATGKSRRGLDRVLGRLGMDDFFDATRCADEAESKPSPLMLNELLFHFRCSPSAAVMVGDTEFDMEMARRAGVSRVAVSFGAHHVDRLREYSPVLCLDEIPQILSLVK